MKRSKSSLSQGKSYREIGEFWDSHDLDAFWDHTREANFSVDIREEVTYYAIDKSLSQQIQDMARKRGIAADTLINLIVQEKIRETA
ncbi:MAG: CopG family antitoxin [Syntrophales bacterium]|nr:CopG family antitoxin [Syntrophales bacterium]